MEYEHLKFSLNLSFQTTKRYALTMNGLEMATSNICYVILFSIQIYNNYKIFSNMGDRAFYIR